MNVSAVSFTGRPRTEEKPTLDRIDILRPLAILLLWVVLTAFRFPCNAETNSPLTPRMDPPDQEQVVKVSFPPTRHIQCADLYFWSPPEIRERSEAILVMAPGRNGNGRRLIVEPFWKEFAARRRLILCGLSFQSSGKFDETCYSSSQSGSGEMLKAGINAFLGESKGSQIPMLMYGFSAGARFTASFVETHPERIVAWCSQAVGRWENARETQAMPPGIVASGEYDAGCYHPSILYFQQGRKLGKPWIWLCLEGLGHQRSKPLDEFVSLFFSEVLETKSKTDYVAGGGFFDIDTFKKLEAKEVAEFPIFSTWLPEGKVGEEWKKLHHP